MFDLTGKVAAVTGAGSGIGQAIAKAFASQGAKVAVLDVNTKASEQTVHQLGTGGWEVMAIECDVASSQSTKTALAQVTSHWGQLDILVNNAGISHIGNCADTSDDEMDKLFNINVKGVYHGMQAALDPMSKNGGGVILNMASIASLIALKDRFAYSMTKGAVLTMTLSVAMDYLDKNIRCNCICPARVHTPFVDEYLQKHYAGHEEQMFEKLCGYQPIGRMAKPKEVAALAVYLCSDEASFITGGVYPIDGGVLNLR